MDDRRQHIVKRLRDEGQKTGAFFAALTDADFDQQVYTTGPGWRVRDLLAHFVSAEQTFVYYGRDILAGGSGAPAGFVIDEYNAAQVAALGAVSSADLVARFAHARGETVALAATMSEADLSRTGRHPWFGQVPLENMLKLIYRHTMLHERDIRKALETRQPVPHVDIQPPAAAGGQPLARST